MAAEQVIGPEGGALLWTNLDAVKGQLDPNVITLAFAFLFIGYGTKVGLVPVHNWLPDAHAEGPTPVSAVLSGLLLNVALAFLWQAFQPKSTPAGLAVGAVVGFFVLAVMQHEYGRRV